MQQTLAADVHTLLGTNVLKSHVHHVQYVDCTQVQYVNCKCALDVLMVKDMWNVDRLVPREPLTQLV